LPFRGLLFALLMVMAIYSTSCRRAPDPLPGFPRIVLWAWERPENLSYIVPKATGVAYLAETITLRNGEFSRRPRLQPLWVPEHTPLIAVVRVESRGGDFPDVETVAAQIARIAKKAPIRAIQIDFDARASEHAYYRQLLSALRRQVPQNVPLEMTALVSWCERDDWIHNLPVVDAVPMFFRMGVDPHSTRERLREPLCGFSIGISTDEFYVKVPRGRRVFVFSDRLWTETSYRAILQTSKQWF
jgi:hypothetical protein